MNMEIGGKKVLIIGGHTLSALQIEHIRRVCENVQLEFQSVVEAMDRMAVISPDRSISVKELIELASKPICDLSFPPNQPKISKDAKEQHKRAARHYGFR